MEYPVFICDDDQDQINVTIKILGRAEMILSDEEKVRFNINTATTYQDAVNYIKEHQIEGGIYFLDVELGKDVNDENGFDIADLIKSRDEKAQIIFVTSHQDLSIITYQRRLGPVDYIVKTDDVDELKKRMVKTIEVALYQIEKFDYIQSMNFTYKIGRIIKNININKVMYITTTLTPHKLLLIKDHGEAQFLGSINEYAENNPKLLVKLSQSCLANPNNIASIDLKNRLVTFKNGDVEEFSRPTTKKMKELLNNFNYKVEDLGYLKKED
ncbi:LytTR family transcriptional regulator DNA-binding domain-containing protein [Lactobacillus sp. LL6]|uniref:LytR/AlgR family response regulator transcription factor n=1 Tax=Lactobacillus sp. LL6 TaxID=2596827 RepID=UPI001184E0A0|nr:LytTR family transcriptional regulator DNA-binding domain-containing protein [Lactobacillus sp. LL6]TSO26993.1 response regulator transcription factor [Lactobacillus sp. LL6]